MPQPDPTYAPTPAPTSASWGRRILALLVDWVTCLAVVEGLVAVGVLAANPNGLDFLHRDCVNVLTWFELRGLPGDPDELFADLLGEVF